MQLSESSVKNVQSMLAKSRMGGIKASDECVKLLKMDWGTA